MELDRGGSMSKDKELEEWGLAKVWEGTEKDQIKGEGIKRHRVRDILTRRVGQNSLQHWEHVWLKEKRS